MHLEFWHPWHMRIVSSIPECDVLVLVGDILTFRMFGDEECSEIWKSLASKAKMVFYVPGNHEFYGGSVVKGLERLLKMEAAFPSNVKLISPDEAHIHVYEGRRFLGGTLWFPDGEGNVKYSQYLGDFHHIKGFTPWVYEENRRTEAFLRKNVREGDVVVTHHLPSAESVDRKYVGSPLNRFFVSECGDVIESARPVLWLHGHTHSSCDYKKGATRVVCNPMGYPNEVSEYDRNSLVELEEVVRAERT